MPLNENEVGPDKDELISQLSEQLGVEFMPAEAELIDDGPKFFAMLEESIKNAEQRIEINIFSWASDSTGMRIADLINKKAETLEHVDIRVDVLGSLLIGTKEELMHIWDELLGKIFASDISFADLLAMKEDPSVVYEWPREKVKKFETALSKLADTELLLRLNPALALLANNPKVNITFEQSPLSQMDHSKIFSFDSSQTYLGGRNIGDDYSGGYEEFEENGWNGLKKPDYWNDYMVKLGGNVATAAHQHFFYAGAASAKENAPETALTQQKVAFLRNAPGESNGPKEKQITHAIFQLLGRAKDEVVIEHAYLMEDRVVAELNRLADEGVKVIILKGGIESAEIAKINDRFFEQLSPKVEVVEDESVFHSKFLTVDGEYSLIGSANLTRESLHHHGEAAVLVAGDGPFQQQLQLRADLLRAKAGSKRIAVTSRKSLEGPI